MPGPSNPKRKPRKSNGKSQKSRKSSATVTKQSLQSIDTIGNDALIHALSWSGSSSPSSPTLPVTPASPLYTFPEKGDLICDGSPPLQHDILPQAPFIYDPGNGPRVRDTQAFLTSFFAQQPALHDPLCAEFAQEEVLQMLKTVLPDETATILWYNKSRATSRICPACQRLYRLGDLLPDHIGDEMERTNQRSSPQLDREQEISGLCSPVCFILASFNYPGAIKSAWGAMANEMDEGTWQALNGPGEPSTQNDVSSGLGMLVRMTRLHDLGLAQLCFPDVDLE